MPQFPFSAGDRFDADEVNLGFELSRIQLTAGESINAATIPQAVYLKASDGKVFLADTDADESTFKFIGFVGQGQNVSLDDNVVVTTSGMLGGFSGLTAGDRQYLSATAGALGTSPISNQGIEIGFAISATQIYIIQRSLKLFTGNDNVSSGTGDVTNVITSGFRPRIIHFQIEASDVNEQNRSWGVWTEGTVFALQSEGTGIFTVSTKPLTNTFTDGRMEITFVTITDTGFSITYDRQPTTNSSAATVRFTVIG